jgi:hypothetical protein
MLAVVRVVEVSAVRWIAMTQLWNGGSAWIERYRMWLSFENHVPVDSNRFVADAMSTVATAAITSNARLIYPYGSKSQRASLVPVRRA